MDEMLPGDSMTSAEFDRRYRAEGPPDVSLFSVEVVADVRVGCPGCGATYRPYSTLHSVPFDVYRIYREKHEFPVDGAAVCIACGTLVEFNVIGRALLVRPYPAATGRTGEGPAGPR